MTGYCNICGEQVCLCSDMDKQMGTAMRAEIDRQNGVTNKPAGRVEDYKFDTSNYVILPTNASEVRAEIVARLDSPEMFNAVYTAIFSAGDNIEGAAKAALTAIIERLNNGG